MMSPSVIFSRTYLLITLILLGGQLPAATVNGRIRLTDSHDSNVTKKKDFSSVVVWLQPLDFTPVRSAKNHVEMLQKDKKFTPHILVISAGTTVDFPNLDPIFHNAFSNFDGKIFDVALYPPGSSRSVFFDRPGIVRVFCNIHPSMSAIIAVLNSPYFAMTDEAGDFAIPNVPAGKYELHFFHERATPETLQRLIRRVSVTNDGAELAAVNISETGYLPAAHKNKYGHDYPMTADDERMYPSPIK